MEKEIIIESGIYAISNNRNGKLYIGQSINLDSRKNQHFKSLKKNKHFNIHLQSSYNKYGENAFDFIVLERCSQKELDAKETYYIEKYSSMTRTKGYNMRSGGGTNMLSEESRKRISETRKLRISQGLIKPIKNVFSKESLDKMSASQIRYWSDETLRINQYLKMSKIPKEKVERIKTFLSEDLDMPCADVAKRFNVPVNSIVHMQQLNSHVYVCKELNYIITNRNIISQKRKNKKVMSMYRQGLSYKMIADCLDLHQRTVIRITNKSKTLYDDKCRLNCINRSILKRDSLVRTLYRMGKNTVEIGKVLNIYRGTVSNILKEGTKLLDCLSNSRGLIQLNY